LFLLWVFFSVFHSFPASSSFYLDKFLFKIYRNCPFCFLSLQVSISFFLSSRSSFDLSLFTLRTLRSHDLHSETRPLKICMFLASEPTRKFKDNTQFYKDCVSYKAVLCDYYHFTFFFEQ
jgi:hypothetical protein